MDALSFFIDNFLYNNKKELWQILDKGKWQKFANDIKYLDKHLNNNCH